VAVLDALRSFTFGKVKKNNKRAVKVPAPGKLKLAQTKEVKGARKRADAKAKVKLPVRPSGKAKRRLTERGRAKVEAEVTYTPTGAGPNIVANADTKALKLIKRR
jgi:hypothetical protein